MYLIIDVGATYTKYAYYNGVELVSRHKIPTVKTGIDEFYRSIQLLDLEKVTKVSISMPGLIDHGFVRAISLLPFLKDHDVQQELTNLLNKDVLVENDAKCATLGEMWKGSLKGVKNGMMIVLGSGIGAKVIIDGKIVDGPRFKAGEIGSILLPDGNKMTNFGRHNNANALIENVAKENNIGCDGKTVFDYLKNHQSEAFDLYCKEVACMIYNLDYILDLDVVLLGGGISENEILVENIKKQYLNLRKKYEEDDHRCDIVSSQYGNDANLLGALYRI